jgi:hypothetical protein
MEQQTGWREASGEAPFPGPEATSRLNAEALKELRVTPQCLFIGANENSETFEFYHRVLCTSLGRQLSNCDR